ncbi:hypothetical protein NUW54_g2646 [Trametes sanguinea]|uniref:Uncharacterized protein n=1 Tax=Trametes sanguinea TaxID=158606 RepID=A0ACC1Q5U5_9APHY|nr:hypothetical protein NUW54_g2646 [Trametes sanguinea]
MSTTVSELGAVYCSIVSFANTREHQEVARGEIVQSLVAIRLKLKRSLALKTNIVYEFSLRGRWPSSRYQKILGLQLTAQWYRAYIPIATLHSAPRQSVAPGWHVDSLREDVSDCRRWKRLSLQTLSTSELHTTFLKSVVSTDVVLHGCQGPTSVVAYNRSIPICDVAVHPGVTEPIQRGRSTGLALNFHSYPARYHIMYHLVLTLLTVNSAGSIAHRHGQDFTSCNNRRPPEARLQRFSFHQAMPVAIAKLSGRYGTILFFEALPPSLALFTPHCPARQVLRVSSLLLSECERLDKHA